MAKTKRKIEPEELEKKILTKKVEKILEKLNKETRGLDMPLIEEMNATEFLAMLYGIYLTGFSPQLAPVLVKEQLLRELKAGKR